MGKETSKEYKWKYDKPPIAECYDCGLAYDKFTDMVIEHDLWEKINPTYDKGCGLLCPNCMATRLNEIGVNEFKVISVAGNAGRNYK